MKEIRLKFEHIDLEEIKKLHQIFREQNIGLNVHIGSSDYRRYTGADLNPEFILAIKMGGSAVGLGFLAAIGSDLWKKLANVIIKLFREYKDPEELEEYNPLIKIVIERNGHDEITFTLPNKNEEEVKKYLNELEDSVME